MRLKSSTECVFRIEGKCVLHRNNCIWCSYKIPKIKGMENDINGHLNFILSKNTGKHALIVSVISLTISALLLAIEFADKIIPVICCN